MSSEWTQDELRKLENVKPEFVGRTPDGVLVPTMSRDDFLGLDARYPSMRINSSRKSREANSRDALKQLEAERDGELRARYPSMQKP